MHSRLLFFLVAVWGLVVFTGLSACGHGKSGSPQLSSNGGADGSSVNFGSSGSSGSNTGAASGSGTPGGSGTGSGSGTSAVGADAAPACMPPSTVPSSELQPFATVHQQLNACTSMQISAFISACVPPGGTPSKCQNWAPPNSKCAACIMPTSGSSGQNTGAGLFDVHGNLVDYNFGGCVSLIDSSSSGLTCAQALDTYVQCIDFACESCADQSSTNNCQSMATSGGACSSYEGAYRSACTGDLAVDGGGTTKCSTGSQVINVICGTGM